MTIDNLFTCLDNQVVFMRIKLHCVFISIAFAYYEHCHARNVNLNMTTFYITVCFIR
jgi:hypothetical protein